MAGVIDVVSAYHAQRASLSIMGRDKGAYPRRHRGGEGQGEKSDPSHPREKLLQPAFGIRQVVVSNEANRKLMLGKHDMKTSKGLTSRGRSINPFTGQPMSSVRVDAGQKVAQILEDNCRRNGVTYWMTAGGDLYIGKPNYVQEPAFQFLLFDRRSASKSRNNIIDATVSRSIEGRYSELKVVGQTMSATPAQLFSPSSSKASKFSAVANDPDLVNRGINRKLIIGDANTLSRQQAADRAKYEQGLRQLKAQEIRITAPGHRQDGRLFTVDTLASVTIEEADISGVYWIAQRRFLRDRGKDRTEITLYPKGLYLA
jgi:prophage tail gpP-like protein